MKKDENMDWLEKALKEDEPYIENKGFSKRVTHALPQRKRLSWSAKRSLIKGSFAFAGISASLAVLSTTELTLKFQEVIGNPLLLAAAISVAALAIAGTCIWASSDGA